MSSHRARHEQMIAVQAMLHECAKSLARAESNMRQEMGGYPSTTPGNGSPGGGKGGRPTLTVGPARSRRADGEWHVVDPGDVDVPVTSVERHVLAGDHDDAALALRIVQRDVPLIAAALARAARAAGYPIDYSPDRRHRLTTTAVRAFAAATELVERGDVRRPEVWAELRGIYRLADRVHHLVRRWGYVPAVRPVDPRSLEVLAVDLTEQWCVSHLRFGVKRPRSRKALCDWCYKITLQVPTWDAPPAKLVRLHVDQGKVYEHQLRPFVEAERARQRAKVRRRRR